ncbi:N-acetylmuramic acid 6-phosphate etherase, partial [Sphingomonas sp. AOB5]|uniref:N-acetylmuramic acid 6-phosphate etherase n=1 Tax=Sphingomonas sp. AOB5 TaxID=3034017 RepID=UPI0023F8FB36
SGRVAVQDGVELGPTYGWPEARTVYLMAGGPKALTDAVEGAEADADAARTEIAAAGVGPDDVVIGVAASGRTPYTVAAVEAARAAGALTLGIANNPDTALLAAAEHPVLIETGSEIVAGSTRMKAGTAQKAALNLFSTATMIRLGGVYRGRMVGMRISNVKLQARGEAMVAELAGVDRDTARAALDAAGRDIRKAVLIASGMSAEAAAAALDAAGGNLREALRA